jgi:hypothetical protein
MCLHDNSRLISVDTSHESAVDRGDQAILKLVSVFAEVGSVSF